MNKCIYIIRHCKTVNNDCNIISGRAKSKISDYSIDTSIIQTKEAFKIITSPSRRCMETISEMKKSIKIIKVNIDDRLLERNMGDLEGKLRCNAIAQYPKAFVNNKFCLKETPPNGESYEFFLKRVYSFYCELVSNNDKNLIICSHNQTLKLLYIIANKIDLDSQWEKINFKNGVLVKLHG